MPQTGEEGCVEDIQWRSTHLRTLANNLVLIPNARLAQSAVTDHHLADGDLAVVLELGVHYGSDLDRVEQVTHEVANEVLGGVEGGAANFHPLVCFHGFGDPAIQFSVTLRSREYAAQYLLKHAFIEALSRRYAAEGILIPVPIRAIDLQQERAGDELGSRLKRTLEKS